MARICTTFICFLALAFATCAESARKAQAPRYSAQTPAAASQDVSNELSVSVGKSVLVDTTEPITRITVGLGDVAEAQATSPTEVLVNGKMPGETSLIIFEAGGGRQFFNVTVHPNSYVANDSMESLRRQLRMELPGQNLKISFDNGLIFLRGTVKDLNSSDRAVQIASTAGKVINLLYVDVPAAEPQILLKVRFASVDRTLEKQLGLNVFSTGAGNTIGTVSTGQFAPPTAAANASTGRSPTVPNPINLFVFRPDINLGATLEALETQGVGRDPGPAQPFGGQWQGGEFPRWRPISLSRRAGNQRSRRRSSHHPVPGVWGSAELHPHHHPPQYHSPSGRSGSQLARLHQRNHHLRIHRSRPRRTQGEHRGELRDGQSFAIGGLLDNRDTETFNKIPFLGDIPILGKFFQSIPRTAPIPN